MTFAIVEEHRELGHVARTLLTDRGALAQNRATLETADDRLPTYWSEIADLGWLGLHLPEALGGQGYSLAELAVVMFEVGRFAAPGPFLSSVVASATIAAAGTDEQRSQWVPGLATGVTVAALGLDGDLVFDGHGALSGSGGLVLGAEVADLILVRVGNDMAVLDRDTPGLTVEPVQNLDPSRRVARVRCVDVACDPTRSVTDGYRVARRLARTLAATEAAGAARACTDLATEYAKVREQFGRVIGSFQAVKHHCANMLVATEQATATAWGAARPELGGEAAELAAAIAAATALPAAVQCAELNIQVLGGIGFTWEHDAHLYLRRALASQAFLGGADTAREDVARLAAEGIELPATIAIPASAQPVRDEVRAFVENYRGLPAGERRKALADSGYLVPHWPEPFGRDAGPIEQLVIDEEFGDTPRVALGISGWNTLTILQNGTPDQIERWIRPSLEGDLDFCQLFSEPGAGSDAAGVQTKGVRVDGGWLVSGQKVWTSGGHTSNRGFATVRTNPEAKKHQGISMMVIDMAAKGVEVRPLKQITGGAEFCEIFFDDVFVPDDDVVGPVDGGWTVARSNLGNERVSIGAGGVRPMPDVVALMQEHAPDDVGIRREVGAVVAADASMTMLNLRRVLRAVEGAEPGAEGNVTKLIGSDTQQQRATVCAKILGPEVATFARRYTDVAHYLLQVRSASIAGGTSEIVRNQIAERILRLPREPGLK